MTSIQMLTQLTEDIYNIVDTSSQTDGQNGTSTEAIPYPNPGQSIDAPAGASLELRQPRLRSILRNINFEYPSSQCNRKALSNVSFKIKPGNIVVIVGENGSGKSTLIPSSSIILDGRPIEDYENAGLRQATAVLNQTQWLYPLSLRENIGLGNTDLAWNDEAVIQAARQGGSYDFISRLEGKFETILDPARPPMANIPRDDPNGPEHILVSELKRVTRKSDISGGERQQVSISRMFMRFNTGKIRLVLVDEPSAALDPTAEQDIFRNLLAEREGKTIVFVTHHFAYLTSKADQIIFMKDGEAVSEIGTYASLMQDNRDYARFFNVRAQAYQSPLDDR
ncbi:P-loop containing nucleoside triphosphate hydrolase protein [Mycena olivaceomarginata]|nr:P-loop containing nucleoside triphosphate hydrolase protein [Mycena olivaceomarginata]